MLKRLFVIFSIICLIFGTFDYCPYIAYADTSVESVTSNDEMVEAFKAYCKSRDLTIDGSLTDAITKFTSESYNDIVNLLGIDPTALQAQISKVYNNNVFERYAFTALGINGFNRIFAQFLLDNDLEVGDKNVNKTVYSGKYFTDDDGNSCLVYYVNFDIKPYDSHTAKTSADNPVVAKGTQLKFSKYDFNSVGSYPQFLAINGYVYNFTFTTSEVNNSTYYPSTAIVTSINSDPFYYGYVCHNHRDWIIDNNFSIFYSTTNGNYGYGIIANQNSYEHFNGKYHWFIYGLRNAAAVDTDVTVVSPDIKPELPDDKPIYIDPDGDVSDDPNGNPDNPTPVPDQPGGTPPDWTLPDSNVTPDGDGGFNFDWNFTLPDLNIDWSIDGLINKFPFSIPHDVYLLCSTLNADPVTPVFQGTIDLKVHQWEIDWDLHEFDNIASLLRNLEVLLFIIGLIMVTRSIIKG